MRHFLALLSFLLVAAPAQAQTAPAALDPKETRINLDASAQTEADNDVMRATLFVEMEDTDPTRLADKINRASNDAIRLAKGFTGLRARTSGYGTYPMTEKSRIVRWRSRSEISVEGEDFRRMSEAIGKLQAIMQLGGVEFSVSPAARARAEEALIQSAIAEFLRKADLVAKSFKASSFSVIEATVSSDGYQPPPRPLMMKSMAVADAAPAPETEAGTSRITVSVSGAILIPR